MSAVKHRSRLQHVQYSRPPGLDGIPMQPAEVLHVLVSGRSCQPRLDDDSCVLSLYPDQSPVC